jgi:plastocyanin
VTETITAQNTAFDVRSFTVASGATLTIQFVNNDAAVVHNIDVYKGGASIGMTPLTPGPASDSLSLGALAPGGYTYKCDVHPQQMTGSFTVQ